jgi:hypothetical protein
MDETEFFRDEGALRIASQIERSIVRLQLDCQAQFVSLVNALEVQLESGAPDANVLRLLADAFLALADVRGLDRNKLKLDQRFDSLLRRIRASRVE